MPPVEEKVNGGGFGQGLLNRGSRFVKGFREGVGEYLDEMEAESSIKRNQALLSANNVKISDAAVDAIGTNKEITATSLIQKQLGTPGIVNAAEDAATENTRTAAKHLVTNHALRINGVRLSDTAYKAAMDTVGGRQAMDKFTGMRLYQASIAPGATAADKRILQQYFTERGQRIEGNEIVYPSGDRQTLSEASESLIIAMANIAEITGRNEVNQKNAEGRLQHEASLRLIEAGHDPLDAQRMSHELYDNLPKDAPVRDYTMALGLGATLGEISMADTRRIDIEDKLLKLARRIGIEVSGDFNDNTVRVRDPFLGGGEKTFEQWQSQAKASSLYLEKVSAAVKQAKAANAEPIKTQVVKGPIGYQLIDSQTGAFIAGHTYTDMDSLYDNLPNNPELKLKWLNFRNSIGDAPPDSPQAMLKTTSKESFYEFMASTLTQADLKTLAGAQAKALGTPVQKIVTPPDAPGGGGYDLNSDEGLTDALFGTPLAAVLNKTEDDDGNEIPRFIRRPSVRAFGPGAPDWKRGGRGEDNIKTPATVSAVSSLGSDLVEGIAAAGPDLRSLGSDLVEGIAAAGPDLSAFPGAVMDAANPAWDAITKTAQSLLESTKTAWDVLSDANAFADFINSGVVGGARPVAVRGGKALKKAIADSAENPKQGEVPNLSSKKLKKTSDDLRKALYDISLTKIEKSGMTKHGKRGLNKLLETSTPAELLSRVRSRRRLSFEDSYSPQDIAKAKTILAAMVAAEATIENAQGHGRKLTTSMRQP